MKDLIREKARELGFDAVGFTSPRIAPEKRDHLVRFLEDGRHGNMTWMDTSDGRRADPEALMDGVRSVIALGVNYGLPGDPLAILSKKERGAISVYAQGARDYHDVIKKRLKRLGRWIVDEFESDIRVFVDTAPVMEKPLAQAAGIGWQGKHTNLVSRRFGSWLFLAEVFTDLDLEPDPPETDHCGSCTRCIDVCPTGAITEPYRLDARRCISYLTIEHNGDIAPGLMTAMGNHVYGCDDCLAVCPWNRFSTLASLSEFHPRAELAAPRLSDLAELDDGQFRSLFRGTAIKRTGRDRFVRNVLIAIGNSAEPALAAKARALLSDKASVVAEAARWAVSCFQSLDGATTASLTRPSQSEER